MKLPSDKLQKTRGMFWSGRRDLNSGPPAPKAGVLPLGSPSFSILLLKAKDLTKEFGGGKMCEQVAPYAWSPPNFPHSESQAKMRPFAPQYIPLRCSTKTTRDLTRICRLRRSALYFLRYSPSFIVEATLLKCLPSSGHGFDPHRPYQVSHSLYRTCDFREAAKGRNKSEARRQIAGESRGTDGKPTKLPHSTAF